MRYRRQPSVRNHNSDINALVDFSVSLLFFFAEPCTCLLTPPYGDRLIAFFKPFRRVQVSETNSGPSYHRDGVTLNERSMQGRIFVEIRILRKSPKKKKAETDAALVAAPPLAPTGEPTLYTIREVHPPP